jgi:YVTN family beta-propeller protein
VAATPNQAFVYVTNGGSDTVSVIATATKTVVATVPLPVDATPAGVAVTPDGAFVYVANSEINSVSVIATARNTVVATIPNHH